MAQRDTCRAQSTYLSRLIAGRPVTMKKPPLSTDFAHQPEIAVPKWWAGTFFHDLDDFSNE
jgi:hypothetical protein